MLDFTKAMKSVMRSQAQVMFVAVKSTTEHPSSLND